MTLQSSIKHTDQSLLFLSIIIPFLDSHSRFMSGNASSTCHWEIKLYCQSYKEVAWWQSVCVWGGGGGGDNSDLTEWLVTNKVYNLINVGN